jgi:hypothetical protein
MIVSVRNVEISSLFTVKETNHRLVSPFTPASLVGREFRFPLFRVIGTINIYYVYEDFDC